MSDEPYDTSKWKPLKISIKHSPCDPTCVCGGLMMIMRTCDEARRIGDEYWYRLLVDYRCLSCGALVLVPDPEKTKKISRREYKAFIGLMRKYQMADGLTFKDLR